jgi:cardiolipin synthase
MISKINTVAQIGFVAAALAIAGFALDPGDWLVYGGYATGVLTVLSAGAYFAAWMRHMAEPWGAK